MRFLHLAHWEDKPYVNRLQALLGANWCGIAKEPATHISKIHNWCIGGHIDAVICTDALALRVILNAMPDYVPSTSGRAISLDDYAGSLLYIYAPIPGGVKRIPAIVLDPLERLVKGGAPVFLAKRYLSKILRPEQWLPQPQFQWKLVTPANAAAVIARCAQARLLSTDIETPWPQNEWRSIDMVGYGAWFPDTNSIECYVIPFTDEWAWSVVREINANAVPKVMQNGLYDNSYFLRWGVPPNNFLWDTFHLFHSYYSELPKSLDFITAFSVRDVRYWKDDGANGAEARYRYNARDCWATICSLLGLLRELPAWAAKNYLVEFPMVFPSLTCNMEGIAVDEQQFMAVRERLLASSAAKLADIQKMLGAPGFNPNSSQQMVRLLAVLGLGQYKAADKATIMKARAVSAFHDFILGAIVDYKKEFKLLTTYLQPSKIWKGRIFYTLNPGKTDTGRLACDASSFDCGLQIQNIPGGEAVKSSLEADPGWQLGEADGEQAEARAVAYLSGDKNLLDLVDSTHDYHSWNAAAFFGVPYEQIYDEVNKKKLMPALRELAKRTNHGANYNMGAQVMLETMGPKFVIQARSTLGLSPRMTLLAVCAHLLEVYANTYPGVKVDWYSWIVQTIEMTSKLVSARGWTRHFFDKPSGSKPALNAAVAHGPQNLSVSIINEGWRRVWHAQIYGELRGRIRMKAQIHDSIFFQFRIGDTAAAERVVELSTVPTEVTDCHGNKRILTIPMAISWGKPHAGKPALRWSDCK